MRESRTANNRGGGVRLTALLGVVVLAASFGLAACNSNVEPSSPAYSQADLRLGTGTAAASGSVVTVAYTGWFYDPTKTGDKGLQFDTTVGKDPLTFTVGLGSVITGWDTGIVGMQVGGIRRLVIPPSLGYGPERYSSIPPNASLVFEIELLDVQ
jgi:FKBP-type peptidyl-prolyl cis-trans isomerase FkpA